MGAASRRAKKTRVASEFDLARLRIALAAPKDNQSAIYLWDLEKIYQARKAQMRGDFRLAAALADEMQTDDALAVAYENRLAPQECIKRDIVPAKNGKGDTIAAEASALFGQRGVGVAAETLSDIHGCFVQHGVAFATMTANPREDGSRVDFELCYWPIEYVRWDEHYRCFFARVDLTTPLPPGEVPADGPAGFSEVSITHGDGRWVVFQKRKHQPWRKAALVPAALVWARHAFATRDWAKGSVAHGNAKVVGEMPANMPLQKTEGDDKGSMTDEAAAFLELLKAIASYDSPAGIRPAGSKTEILANPSNQWQVWSELARNAEKASARIYLGTDGTLGSQGGAPGVDIESLFGVAATRVQGDLACLERGINTVIEIWCAINFGDSTLAPKVKYLIPDGDADAAREASAKRRQAFFLDVEKARANGFDVTSEWVAKLAKDHGIESPPLKVAPPAAPSDPTAATAAA